MLVDNFRVGTLAKWGFDEAWFDAHAPRVVLRELGLEAAEIARLRDDGVI